MTIYIIMRDAKGLPRMRLGMVLRRVAAALLR